MFDQTADSNGTRNFVGVILSRVKPLVTAPKVSTTGFVLLCVGAAALRISYCISLPVNTGDVLRHLFQGLAVLGNGISTAGAPLTETYPGIRGVAWANQPYNYPVVTLAFFSGVAAIHPTIFFAKFCLTLIEGYNSWQLYRLTNRRWVGAAYWVWPCSIWWVSGEAQFEPLQSLFVFAGLRALVSKPRFAGGLLALAVQVKLSAVLLFPYFVSRLLALSTRDRIWATAWLGVAFAPTAIAALYYPILEQTVFYSPPMTYNPYYWDWTHVRMFGWNPPWLIAWNQIVTYGLLVLTLFCAMRERHRWVDYFGLGVFLIVCKSLQRAQFWYLLLIPSFAVSIRSRVFTMTLFLALPLLEVRSLVELLFGPFGYTVGGYYRSLTVWDALSLPG